ncbi:MAG: hypothetical protein ACTHJT_09515, partial [Cytophaga sp.]|uniref:hypothetical protein n=1 Tax=Cytophaga sp. TaxID=29535 RepID=UPI003F8093D8
MKKRIIVLIYLLLCVIQTTVNAQPIPNQDYMNQAKYWFYRNRLINEFCKVGPNQGESIPFQSMNYVTHYGNAGDGGIQKLGHYIGVLATEIKLLRNSNQSTSKTVEELFYALYAAYRLDATAETYDFCYDVDAENAKPKIQNDYPYYSKCQGDPGSWNGFMLRDDKNPKSSSAIYNHFKNMTGITNFQCDFGLNIAPYGQTTIEVSNHASTLNDASHDQLGNLLIGLRLVQFCLNGTEYYTYSGTSYNLKQFSTNIASILMGYLAAGSPNNTVNCNYINNMMGAPSQLTKWYSYLLPVGVSNCSSVGPFVNGSGNIPWLFSNTVINQPSSIENDDIGGAFPYFLSEGYALTGKQLTGQSYTTTKISKIAWNEFPRTLSKSIYQLGDSWKILSLASISDGWTSSYIPCGILPVACTTKVCIAKTIWNGKCVLSVPVPAKCTANIDCVSKDFVLYDQCWRANFQVLPLMYNVLNNKIGFNSVGGSPASTTAYINFFQSHIDNAPCRGPYCMGANDKAANDWASWSILLSADAGNNHKWTDGPDGGGGTDLGEYNGLDYMLMYNLYNIY